MANKNSTGKDGGDSTSKKLTKKQQKNLKEATERYDVCFSLGVKDGFLDGTVYGDRDEMAVMLLSFLHVRNSAFNSLVFKLRPMGIVRHGTRLTAFICINASALSTPK